MPLNRLLRPLGTAARVFFRHELSLRREDGRVQLVLEERLRPGEARPETPAEAAARRQRELLALMASELAAVLDELPGTRRALRHLVAVEAALGSDGLQALERLPLVVLRRALAQFEGLVTNWSPVGLATLRSKIAVAVNERTQAEAGDDDEDDPYRTTPGAEREALPTPDVVPLEALPEAEAALAAAYAAALGAAALPGAPAASGAAAPGASVGAASAGSASSRAYREA